MSVGTLYIIILSLPNTRRVVSCTECSDTFNKCIFCLAWETFTLRHLFFLNISQTSLCLRQIELFSFHHTKEKRHATIHNGSTFTYIYKYFILSLQHTCAHSHSMSSCFSFSQFFSFVCYVSEKIYVVFKTFFF